MVTNEFENCLGARKYIFWTVSHDYNDVKSCLAPCYVGGNQFNFPVAAAR